MRDSESNVKQLTQMWENRMGVAWVREQLVKKTNGIVMLDLSNQSMKTLHKDITMCTTIQELVLRKCDIKKIPESIGKMSNLLHIDLSRNKLDGFPDALCRIRVLITIDVAHNKIQQLPQCIGNLKRLKSLNVSFNKLNCLPESIGECGKLETVSAMSNQIQFLPPSIKLLKNLVYLDLAKNLINSLDSLEDLPVLECLDVSYNRVLAIESAMGALPNLRSLWMQNNQITSVSEFALSGWKNLDTLNLNRNKITCINGIGHLKKLLTFWISHNQLQNLPDKITSLGLLLALDVSHNNLNSLPFHIGKLGRLNSLNLEHNEICELPESICDLTNLRYLNLHGNEVKKFPANFKIKVYDELNQKTEDSEGILLDNNSLDNLLL